MLRFRFSLRNLLFVLIAFSLTALLTGYFYRANGRLGESLVLATLLSPPFWALLLFVAGQRLAAGVISWIWVLVFLAAVFISAVLHSVIDRFSE